jgi:hypothetical protein
MFSDTNPTLLAVTIVVSIFHLLFDFLAFKSDIAFWKGRKTYEGLSGSSLLLNLVCQSVIFLYLMDNDASKLILVSSGASLSIETWKLTRIFRVRLTWTEWRPNLSLGHAAKTEQTTNEHDGVAMYYMCVVIAPLILAYSAYSLQVCCLLSVVCCLLSAVCCLLSAV